MDPLLTNYECDTEKITITKRKIYNNENINKAQNKNNKINFTQTTYYLFYQYTNLMKSKFLFLTDYMTLHKCEIYSFDMSRKKIIFTVANDNLEFVKMIKSVVDVIKKYVNNLYLNTEVIFITPVDDKEFYKIPISLKSIFTKTTNGEFDKYVKSHNGCKIYFTRPKSKGGDTVLMENDEISETFSEIRKEMPLFNNGFYMRKSDDPKYADKPDIHYVGKFLLEFCVEIRETFTDPHEKTIKANIYLIASKAEIKYNVSKPKSVLTKDILNMTIQPDKITSVSI